MSTREMMEAKTTNEALELISLKTFATVAPERTQQQNNSYC